MIRWRGSRVTVDDSSAFISQREACSAAPRTVAGVSTSSRPLPKAGVGSIRGRITAPLLDHQLEGVRPSWRHGVGLLRLWVGVADRAALPGYQLGLTHVLVT